MTVGVDQLRPAVMLMLRYSGPPLRMTQMIVCAAEPKPTRSPATTSVASSKPLHIPFTAQSSDRSSATVALIGSLWRRPLRGCARLSGNEGGSTHQATVLRHRQDRPASPERMTATRVLLRFAGAL